MWVSLPATVVSFNKLTMVCSASISVLSDEDYPYPIVHDIPVIHTGGSGFSVSSPLSIGDPILLVFCHRGIDNAMTAITMKNIIPQKPSGGVMGINSPIAIPIIGTTGDYVPMTGISMHNKLGTTRIEVHDNEVEVYAESKGFVVKMDGSVEFTNGARITASGDFVSASGVSLSTHVHTGVVAGGELSGTPFIEPEPS